MRNRGEMRNSENKNYLIWDKLKKIHKTNWKDLSCTLLQFLNIAN